MDHSVARRRACAREEKGLRRIAHHLRRTSHRQCGTGRPTRGASPTPGGLPKTAALRRLALRPWGHPVAGIHGQAAGGPPGGRTSRSRAAIRARMRRNPRSRGSRRIVTDARSCRTLHILPSEGLLRSSGNRIFWQLPPPPGSPAARGASAGPRSLSGDGMGPRASGSDWLQCRCTGGTDHVSVGSPLIGSPRPRSVHFHPLHVLGADSVPGHGHGTGDQGHRLANVLVWLVTPWPDVH